MYILLPVYIYFYILHTFDVKCKMNHFACKIPSLIFVIFQQLEAAIWDLFPRIGTIINRSIIILVQITDTNSKNVISVVWIRPRL